MTDTARIIALWPRWTSSVGAMQRLQIQVRTQCRRCGALMRADVDELVARYGGNASLIDRQERCRMVACDGATRSEEHTSELQSLMRISYAVFCLKKKNT